jgi:LysR family transcriptional regulator, nod-box dependent transcriptional activator
VAPRKSRRENADWLPARRLNLNLLYPLDAILNASTLTAAGQRTHLSQPAMSHALRRLRDHFGDDLVTFSGGGKSVTALGEALRPEIRRVMRELEGAFSLAVDFDPATTTRQLTIATSEMIERTILTPVLQKLSGQAPTASFRVVPLDTAAPERSLELGADIILLQSHFTRERLMTRQITVDRLACMMRRKHPALDRAKRISAERYAAARHVVSLADSVVVAPSDKIGETLLARRVIAIRATTQAAIPWYLINSDLIATGSSSLFQSYASMLPLIVTTPPFPSDPVTVVAQWASDRRHDPMLAWLVAELADSVPKNLRP